MQCGGMKKTTKMKKMQKGGMKTTVANKNDKTFIAGMPNSGPTGPNYQGINTMQKGGTKKKLTKAQAGAAVPSGTMMSDGRVYADKKYKPTPPVSSAVPAGTKMSDGRTWDGKRYVQKGGASGYMKGVSNAVKKKIVDSPVKPMGPDRPAPKPMMAKTGGSAKSFPDLTGDGKVTKADVLKGRGVIKKKGGVMKAKFGASVSVQRSPKAGKVRSASAQGYSAVGKREPGRAFKKTITKKK